MRQLLVLLVAMGMLVAGCSSGAIDTTTASTTATTAASMTTVEEGVSAVAGTSFGIVSSAGLEREYLLHVPESYDGMSRWPVVVVFHGYTMTAREQFAASGFEEFSEEEGFIAVFPEGRGDIQRWLFELDAVEVDISSGNPDIELAADLIDHLSKDLNIDTSRVYAAGFSNGGWMASAIGCTLPDRFAAVAPVAGIMDFGDDCKPASAVPMVTFHGTADQYEPFDGGVDNAPLRGELPTDLGGTYDELPMVDNRMFDPSVPDKTALSAERNGCAPEPLSTPTDGGVTRWEYDCPAMAGVVLYEGENGHHWWDLEIGLDTNAIMWEFFTNQTP